MLDNYAEETRPLFKLLRTEAFRFVLVHFNHYSLINQLKKDLRERFPSRAVAGADAGEVSYRQLADKYYELGKGIFLIDNFESVLNEPEKYNGLNLHRDKLAQYPIAMICFISPGAQALSAREIMEKMPDLWSFRSFMLDLKREVETSSASSSGSRSTATETKISSLGGYTYKDKLAELERLQTEISKIAPGETSLLQTLYSQVKTIQQDVGFYTEALKTIDVLKTYTPDKEGLADLFFQEGDLLTTIGKSRDALNAFNIAMSLYSEYPETNKGDLAIINERLGDIYMSLGDIEQANHFFTRRHVLAEELFTAYPDNVSFKNGLAISYEKLGNIQSALGNLDKALSHYEQHNQLEEQLYKAYPDNAGFKNNLAISYQYLGNTQADLGNLDKALFYYEQYNQLKEQLYKAYPDNVAFKNGLAISYSKLGETQSSLGNLDKALSHYEQYNQLEEQLHQAYPDNVGFKNSLAISYQYFGNTQSLLGNLDKALSHYEQYNQLEEQLHQAYPDNVGFKNSLAISYSKLGNTQSALGNLDKALSYYKQNIKLSEELYQAYPNNVGFKNGLALSYQWLGWFQENKMHNAEKAYEYYTASKKLLLQLVESFPEYVEFKKNLNWVTNKLPEQ